MRGIALLISSFALASGASATSLGPMGSGISSGGSYVGSAPLVSAIYANYRYSLRQLRRDGLELQQRDGGTLTAQDRGMLQDRLTRINEGFRHKLRNDAPIAGGYVSAR